MANILKVTTPPSTNYNNTVKGSPQVVQNPQIKNQVDLQRVPRNDEREAQQGLGRQPMHYTSNYNKFLENVQSATPATHILRELFGSSLEGATQLVGENSELARELTELFEMMQLDEGNFSAFAKSQFKSASPFQSALFDVLRSLMNESRSVELKSDILKFTKMFNDMTSGERLLGSIELHLQQLSESIPRSDAQLLQKLMENLKLHAKNGDTQHNLNLLKNSILPLLSKYVSRTNDLGKTRDLLSLLSLNISRYENGSRENVLAALKNLTMYNSFKERIGAMDQSALNSILERLENEKAAMSNPFADKLSSIMEKGLSGQAGYENRIVFENLARSILVNESVYMPLLYSLISAEVNGKQLFSEMWIDPDDGNRSLIDEKERIHRIYLRFNIEELGSFDMIMNMKEGKVDLQLLCPEALEKNYRQIREDIGKIIEKNSLRHNQIYVEAGSTELSLMEVFPRIKEGRNNINVSI